jgi:hypothetical protein
MFRVAVLASLSLALLPRAALAAESYDNCAGTVLSLPATITSPGVWCMKSDLATAMTSGQAITINSNNVTLDCNNFRLGGLAAGAATATTGIAVMEKNSATIRNCNVRGFINGVYLGGSSNVIEDSRFDSNMRIGIYVSGYDFIVRRNAVTHTGGTPTYMDNYGILAYGGTGVIEGNFVSAVLGNTQAYPYAQATGIFVGADHTVIRGNDVSGIVSGADSTAAGIVSGGARNKLIDNTVSALSSGTGQRRGLSCTGDPSAVAIRNTISDTTSAATAVWACTDGGGNISH